MLLTSYKLQLLLFFMIIYSSVNIIYQLLVFIDLVDGIVEDGDITESFVSLLFSLFILIGLLIKNFKGWLFSYIVSILSVVYIIIEILLYNTGTWVYIYLFGVVCIFSLLLDLLTNLAIKEKYMLNTYSIWTLKLIYKLFYSMGMAFLFMSIVGDIILSLFVTLILFMFLLKPDQREQNNSNQRGQSY